MNPFLLPGPQFLFFYALLAALVFVACWFVRSTLYEASDPPPVERLSDPYEIAVLRDGPGEAVRVGLLALASRGAAHAAGAEVKLDDAPLIDAHPFERALAQEIASGRSVPSIEKAATIEGRLGSVTSILTDKGLLLASEQQTVLVVTLVAGGGLLGIVAAAKIWTALAKGHTNILFLLIACVAAMFAIMLLHRRRTPRGEAALLAVKDGRSGATLASGTSPSEVALSAALFGLGVAPLALQPFVFAIQTPVRSGGAGCSSDGGSGGGGGGGDGGGCGGGCGGCGGCGGG